MKPIFPSITFPNHYSLVTGLYAESHGIVGNKFFDPDLNDTFYYKNSTKNGESKWWLGEPIWVTAVKQGKKSATCMWPGSEAPIMNTRPTYWLKYNSSMSMIERVDQVLRWIDLPRVDRPSFISLYMDPVDSAGHAHGPHSPQVDQALRTVDDAIGKLLDGISTRGLNNTINVVVVSDHGMTERNFTKNWIYLDDFIDVESVDFIDNVAMSVTPKRSNETDLIYSKLKNASDASSGIWSVWKKDDVPKYFHYSKSKRIGSIVMLPISVSITISYKKKKKKRKKERRAHYKFLYDIGLGTHITTSKCKSIWVNRFFGPLGNAWL